METVKIIALLILTSAIFADCKEEFKSRNLDPVYPSEWELPPLHSYDQIFDITDNNHDMKIMKSSDAWIVVFYQDKLHGKWRQLAEEIGGAVWFGTVNIDEFPKLIKKLKLDPENLKIKGGAAVVYPFGVDEKEVAVRKGKLKIATTTKQAELFASATIPDRTTDIEFTPDSMQKFNDWVVGAYYTGQPPKFPVLCITDDSETPIHVKVLTYYFYTHFTFGIVRKSSVPAMRKQFMQVPEPQKYPTFLILLGREPSSEEMARGIYNMHFNIMPYIDQKYGDPAHIRSIINYLFTSNDDYRKSLPGKSSDETKDVASMKSIRTGLTERVSRVSKNPKKKSKKTEL